MQHAAVHQLRLDRIGRSFGDRRVLTDVALVVGPEARVGLMGENGAGRSTLLHLLHGDLAPTSGGVQRAPGVRTALLVQDVVLRDPGASPRALHRRALGEARAEAVPLSPPRPRRRAGPRPPGGILLVGQQRRLALAVAVADPPDLLLLDEPTNHLSLALAEDLEEPLAAHPGEVVLASHDRWLRRRRWAGATLPL